jgi:hypothetical protein
VSVRPFPAAPLVVRHPRRRSLCVTGTLSWCPGNPAARGPLAVLRKYFIVVPTPLPVAPHRYLIAVPRPLLAAPLVVRRRYSIFVLRPLPETPLVKRYR